jgi:hypothetical protein
LRVPTAGVGRDFSLTVRADAGLPPTQGSRRCFVEIR